MPLFLYSYNYEPDVVVLLVVVLVVVVVVLGVVDVVALEVVALEEGTGKNEGMLGALVVEGEDDGKFFKLNVGSGLTDENREQIWANQDSVIGQLVEIRADAATQSQDAEDTWSLRFPRFKTFRGFDLGEKI